MKKRILFVDDEAKLLEGLQRMLRPMRQEWEMRFVQSGGEALSLLEREPFDVVVSDMRMPGMDGAQLLGEVKRRFPRTVRIILSGHSEKEFVLKSVKTVHQYLSKPCDPETLKSVIRCACSLSELLDEGPIKELVSSITSLPSLSSLYFEMLELLRSPDASLQKVGEIISRDMGMTAKILQLVNSAFFGLPRQISNPAQAVTLLGLEVIRTLVLSIHIFEQFDQGRQEGVSLEELWTHSIRTGILAKGIAKEEGQGPSVMDDAFTAGLLHDLGKPLLAVNFPHRYREVVEAVRCRKVQAWEVEQQVWGTTHSVVGAYLLRLWGLPDPIVEAVAFHHCATERVESVFSPLLAVSVANALEQGPRVGEDLSGLQPLKNHLERLGMGDRFVRWMDVGRQIRESEVGASRHGSNPLCR